MIYFHYKAFQGHFRADFIIFST